MKMGYQIAGRRRAVQLLVALAFAMCLTAVSSIASANEDHVGRDKLPPPVRIVLDNEVAAARGHEVAFYKTDDNEYFVHFGLPNGLFIEIKTRRDGSIIAIQPTRRQPELSKEKVRPFFDHYVADRQHAIDAEHRHAEVERVKVVEVDRVRPEDEAAYRAAVDRERELQRHREEEARRDHARQLSEAEATEYYAGRRYERIELAQMPFDTRGNFRDWTRDASDVEYYRFTKSGVPYYATKFTTAYGRREEIITNEQGRLNDRIELYDRPAARGDIHDRDLAWDREHRWDRERMNRTWIPERTRVVLDEQVVGATDVDYFRYVESGRTYYATRYTTVSGHRIECRADAEGRLVEKVSLYSPSEYRTR